MRRLLLTAVLVCLATSIPSAVKAQSAIMPGSVVSTTPGEQVKSVGGELPRVAKQVGHGVQPNGPMMRPYNPNNPYEALQGTNLSVKSIVAPVNGYQSQVAPSMFSQVVDTLKSIAGINTKPIVSSTPIFVPGIYRRDRERVKERMVFIRD